jgi:hypothetical protein
MKSCTAGLCWSCLSELGSQQPIHRVIPSEGPLFRVIPGKPIPSSSRASEQSERVEGPPELAVGSDEWPQAEKEERGEVGHWSLVGGGESRRPQGVSKSESVACLRLSGEFRGSFDSALRASLRMTRGSFDSAPRASLRMTPERWPPRDTLRRGKLSKPPAPPAAETAAPQG